MENFFSLNRGNRYMKVLFCKIYSILNFSKMGTWYFSLSTPLTEILHPPMERSAQSRLKKLKKIISSLEFQWTINKAKYLRVCTRARVFGTAYRCSWYLCIDCLSEWLNTRVTEQYAEKPGSNPSRPGNLSPYSLFTRNSEIIVYIQAAK